MSLVTINLKSFACRKDTSEFDSDEPYVLVFAANLKSPFPGFLIPTAHTVLYGPWGSVDSGDKGKTGYAFFGPGGTPLIPPENFWGLDGAAKELNNSNDVIFLVGLMENDNGNPGSIRVGLHAQLFAALTSYANAGFSRGDMVRKLLADMRDALKGLIAIGIPNKDDLIGVGELVVNTSNRSSGSKIDSITLVGDGGRYELFFETTFQSAPPPRPAITGPFDSLVSLRDGRTFATFGDQYICYIDQNASIIPATYPRPIKGNWGKLPSAFESGFDSMATLPDGKTYITKGNQYIRYSDASANFIDSSYPRPIKGNWGKLPSAFESGFDSMVALPNGKIYITKGDQYLRYSDASANILDAGYPKPIAGNWG